MTSEQTDQTTPRKPLRLWPGVIIAVLQLLSMFVLPAVVPGALIYGMLGGVVGALAILLWWVFFSRALWAERLGVIVLMIAGLAATWFFLDKSIAGTGRGMLFPVYGLISVSIALVVGAVAGRRLSAGPRRAVLAASILLACVAWTLVRTGGITGDANLDVAWRWSQTPEERLLALAGDVPAARPQAPAAAETGADWPGFRGAERDGIARGARIATDWKASPPVELWRRPIGPGWSSFAVHGDRVYTQEQRGEHELVTCYSVTSGEPVWVHRDAARFYEANAGAGPRGTPTLGGGPAPAGVEACCVADVDAKAAGKTGCGCS
ncbi:MAG TPA: hypothetical protein VFZ44_15585 [Pyrinomonadaceae bacterium]